ncbi:LysR family transcriptional regulator [Streptomyces sp. 7-21]|jgi:DNA-binding transcriptional LysR family regulator|uniref:LysR family transcriptional regulator n=1 Tax=Streptomyces sp. 7-21 TaxID=2802283 RepID=UPI00191E3BC9|nr:LysR family transcriptional regulator [Streptomyces sp. 7-21]MBL1065951.1 LysR family transcriptional regulator [Streptomyces sp. 7-21]
MNLDQLRYIVLLAEELHFARAATKLGLQPPRLSQQVRKLEDELGVQLFERTTREVQITSAGKNFVAEAAQALHHAERAKRVARQTGRGEVGQLSLGFVGSAAHELLPRLLRRFRRNYPNVKLQLRELASTEQIDELLAGSLDVGILHAHEKGVDQDEVVTQEISRDRLVAALSRRHPLAHRDPLPIASLAEESFVLFPRHLGPSLHDNITRLTRAAGFEPQVSQEAVHMHTIIGLVAADIGVSIVPGSMATLRRTDVVFRTLTPQTRSISLHLAWRRGDTSPVVRNFRALSAPRL